MDFNGAHMKRKLTSIVLAVCLSLAALNAAFASSAEVPAKPAPDSVLSWLSEGNARFVQGKSVHPHADAKRISLADTENQGKYALATVLSCSDSRVPPELVFDAGVMDLFVVRVAGNVANTDEIGSLEYGLAHVNTPLLVVLGHTQCGAVTAVTQELTGHGHPLERNIPPLVGSIVPAVKQTMKEHPELKEDKLITAAIEANVWEVIKNIFLKSPATRELVKNGQVKVVGAIYDMHTGGVNWLLADKVAAILKDAEASPERAVNAMYDQAAEPKPASKDGKPADEQPWAPKIKELGLKIDSKSAEAASDIKDLKAKLDALGNQLKSLADNAKTSASESGVDTLKSLSSELKGLKSGMELRLSGVESSANWMFWALVILLAFCVLCFCWLFWKLGSLGSQHAQLKDKTRKAFERINGELKRSGR